VNLTEMADRDDGLSNVELIQAICLKRRNVTFKMTPRLRMESHGMDR